jgi:O-antigen/teichoic acid export membrane protein
LLYTTYILLKSIFNTASLKLLSNFIMLAVLWLTVHFLGDAGRGEVAIFTANLTLVILINGFIGSSVIVYLTPRTNFYNLLIPSYIWAIVSSIFSPMLLKHLFVFLGEFYGLNIKELHLENTNYYYLLVVCSFLGSMFEYHYMVLLGKQKIVKANLLNFIRQVILLLLLLYFFYYSGFEGDVFGFFLAMIITYFIAFVYSCVLIIKEPDSLFQLTDFWKTLGSIVKLGFIDQVSNVLQFLNKRIPMYSLFLLYGKGITGVLSVAIALSEAFLFLTQSVSTVQYAHISNTNNASNNIQISIKLFRLSLVALSIAMLGLLVLPDQFYVFLFKQEFSDVRSLIAVLAVGIIAYGVSNILNHYFSGIGKFEQNVYCNVLSLAFTIGLGAYYLVPKYGIWGAALTPTVANLILLLYLIIAFLIKTKSRPRVLIPQKEDLLEFKTLLLETIKKRR